MKPTKHQKASTSFFITKRRGERRSDMPWLSRKWMWWILADEYWLIHVAQATWWKTIKNLRVHLNITKVKVVHHVSHQNFFKKSNIGIVLPLKERMAPSLFSWNWVENIILRRKGTYLFVQCLSLFESSSPETQKTCKKVTDLDLNGLVDY